MGGKQKTTLFITGKEKGSEASEGKGKGKPRKPEGKPGK